MLRAIEQATRSPIQQMRLPTLRDIADKRTEQFKAQLVETLDSQDVTFYRDLVDKLVSEEIGEPADIAAAIAHLLFRERPLAAADEPEPPMREFSRDFDDRRPPARRNERAEGRGDSRREPRGDVRRPDGDMRSFTIDVGRSHGVMPKDIVGAIANEGGIGARQIGAIKLFDTYSTVELPAGLPNEVFQALGRTWIRGQRINLQPTEGGARKPSAPPKRSYGGDKPGGDKPPRKKKVEGLTLPPSKYRAKPKTDSE
jgi:ATP-dependent RNA helicase DeaD